MIFNMNTVLASAVCLVSTFTALAAAPLLAGKKILYIEREQYLEDHHNTATLFQVGEINEGSFRGGSAMRIYDMDSQSITTLLESKDGVIRDPELSYDGTKIVFSMRLSKEGFYHIYEMDVDGKNLKQLTRANSVSDIDPAYLPDGSIVFSSTRQPKYCMCNRHIMANLFRMEADGANIEQIGMSTLFEGHAHVLSDGRILYDRWEYVDRNFGDAQGLWTVNPDGTKHSIYYGNNTASPGGVIDARQIPDTDLVVCVFAACHEQPWGALAVLDRKKGVDGKDSVVTLLPVSTRPLLDHGHLDSFQDLTHMPYFVEDPFPLNKDNFLVSSSPIGDAPKKSKSGLFVMSTDGKRELILEGEKGLFDPMIIEARPKPPMIPSQRSTEKGMGVFYVQNVYEGTHMQGVKAGEAKYLRVIESPEKRTWTRGGWGGQGEQAPAVNWHSFEVKRILGDVEISPDGSANFKAPSGKFLYFQLLDKDKKMIQSMRSGTMLMSGEVNGCIGCHEDRLNVPPPMGRIPLALRKKPVDIQPWQGKEPRSFSYAQQVQPILDRRCVSCHDWDDGRLVLAGDKNPFFNASYINLYVAKQLKLVGGGPAAIQQPRSWGSHASPLTAVIEGKKVEHPAHHLTAEEKEVLYAWMDVNGVYYPVYESAFDSELAGRSPLSHPETQRLAELTGVNLFHLAAHYRQHMAQISFERPEKSPILASLEKDSPEYNEAIAIISLGARRLKLTPRGDIESELTTHPRLKQQLENYALRLQEQEKFKQAQESGTKAYDP